MSAPDDFDLDTGLRRWAYGDRHAFTLSGLRRLRTILPTGHDLAAKVDAAISTREKQHADVRKKYDRVR